jgi:hypothetical protein
MTSDGDESESEQEEPVDESEAENNSSEEVTGGGLGLYNFDFEVLTEPLVNVSELRSSIQQANRVMMESVDWGSLHQAIQTYFESIAQTVANDIDGLESPEDYDSGELTVSPEAEELAKHSTDQLIEELESGEYGDLELYLDRIRNGRQHIEDGNYGAATFYFISVQDGLMSMLCDHYGCSRNSDGYFARSTKVTAFARTYNNHGYYGVETGEIIPPYEDFYDHRNAIVHGSPTSAYLDRDIAFLSMLFMMLTLDSTVSEMT